MGPLASLATTTSHNTGGGKGSGGGALLTDLSSLEVMRFVATMQSKSVEAVQCGTLWGVCHQRYVISSLPSMFSQGGKTEEGQTWKYSVLGGSYPPNYVSMSPSTDLWTMPKSMSVQSPLVPREGVLPLSSLSQFCNIWYRIYLQRTWIWPFLLNKFWSPNIFISAESWQSQLSNNIWGWGSATESLWSKIHCAQIIDYLFCYWFYWNWPWFKKKLQTN